MEQGRQGGERSIRSAATDPYPAPVRTRTLLILAVVCGFAILAAGSVQLFRIAGGDPSDTETFELGESVDVGDLTVVVESSAETNSDATVTVQLSGVDDPDGTGEFRLIVPGESLAPTGRGEGHCGATTVEQQECLLAFDVDDAPGGSRILLYRRGDDVARWELAGD